MKRKDIITALIKEGFSDKTLANLSDKQLGTLSGRILGEQYNPNDINTVHIPKTDVNAITQAKQQKKQFVAYEGEMTEDKDEEKKKGDKKEKEDVIKKLKYKIEHTDDKDKVKSYKELLKRMEDGDVKTSGKEIDEGEEKPKFKSKTEWLKSKGIIKDDDKKEETKESIAPASQPVSKPGEPGIDLTEWVNGVVEKRIHPFTSKNDIMRMITQKLDEQEVMEPETTVKIPDWLSYDSIKNAEVAEPAEPAIKPRTKPGEPNIKPNRPATPYQPGPGINPAPKAEKTQ